MRHDHGPAGGPGCRAILIAVLVGIGFAAAIGLVVTIVALST